MKAAKEAVRANPEARETHYLSEDHQGFCQCDICGQEVEKKMSVTKTLTIKYDSDDDDDGEDMECPVFDHEGRNTILHTEIWSFGKRLD